MCIIKAVQLVKIESSFNVVVAHVIVTPSCSHVQKLKYCHEYLKHDQLGQNPPNQEPSLLSMNERLQSIFGLWFRLLVGLLLVVLGMSEARHLSLLQLAQTIKWHRVHSVFE